MNGQPDPQAQPSARRLIQTLLDPSTWTVVLLVVFGGSLVYAIMSGGPAVGRLADPAYARGAITWIISLATIGLAFVLVYQAFFSTESSDDRFRRAREVFTGLMGVMGTIVGFYFGSADQPGNRPAIADLRFNGPRVTTIVTGGAAPYRYSVEHGTVKTEIKLTTDGWIEETLPSTPQPGTEVKITVTDARNQEVSKTGRIPQAAPTQAPPPAPAPSAPQKGPAPPGGS